LRNNITTKFILTEKAMYVCIITVKHASKIQTKLIHDKVNLVEILQKETSFFPSKRMGWVILQPVNIRTCFYIENKNLNLDANSYKV